METTEVISRRMARIRSKDTTPERILRSALWSAGLRYRKHYLGVVGVPDIAFPSVKVAVFCDGIFWHGRDWNTRENKLKTANRDYWKRKIERNINRDIRVNRELADLGWKVHRFWEDEIVQDPARCVEIVCESVGSRKKTK